MGRVRMGKSSLRKLYAVSTTLIKVVKMAILGDPSIMIGHMIDIISEEIVPLGNRGLDLSSSIGENNVEAVRPYFLQQSFTEAATERTCDPMIGLETSSQDSQTSTGRSFQLTIKAYYGGDLIKFKLSASSKIDELNQHVFQRLQLHLGTYVLSYQDDDGDRILITCNDDLLEYVNSSAALGKGTSEMWIEPRHVL